MATIQQFDQLNRIATEKESNRSIPIEQFFDEMELTEEQKEERKALAYNLQTVFNDFFTLVASLIIAGSDVDYELLSGIAVMRYLDALKTQGIDLDDKFYALNDYVARIVSEIVLTTQQHDTKEPYYLSQDRATNIAENESNTIFNNVDMQRAIDKGYKSKEWRTFRDKRVRHTHSMIDGEIIGIYDTFLVGDSEMAYPKDTTYGADAKEIVNCRCVLKYHKKSIYDDENEV